ncbi:hypothetical protein BN59_00880 [Legionella massiliensis]|uniref:Integral membrane protein (PIN domain superfamily) n=1 Tax=Legionella massiliensis TaxID=1034943 RepID=A0A078KU94_9GAMM|nr:hypothetical protein [Legionella massiliensis]CDZ76606.1 hypothetical protein BN59_00880 [Legionella massiliensis]CEE12344.1 hypothetical protein BN1094_00880 [Legionella massiliensis]
MDRSKFLGKVLGLYLILISLAMLINMTQFAAYIQILISNAPLMLVTGCFTLILGLLIVVSHNIWKWNWQVVVTIIGWLILLKGISIIFYPAVIDKLTILFVQNTKFAYLSAGIDLILGVLLSYFGFKR